MSPNEELSSQLTELHLHISEFLQNLESEKAEESDVIVPAEKTNTSIYGTPSEFNGTYNGTPRIVFMLTISASHWLKIHNPFLIGQFEIEIKASIHFSRDSKVETREFDSRKSKI